MLSFVKYELTNVLQLTEIKIKLKLCVRGKLKIINSV